MRWGGTIASVNNRDDDTTELQIVSRPLDRRGRPRHVDVSEGRFVAEVDGFLDPEIVRRRARHHRDGDRSRACATAASANRTTAFPVVRVDDYSLLGADRARVAVAPPGPYGPYGVPGYGYAPYGAYGAYGPYGVAPWGYPAARGYYPYDFNTRFWHEFWHDPIHRPRPRGGRVGVGVTVRP